MALLERRFAALLIAASLALAAAQARAQGSSPHYEVAADGKCSQRAAPAPAEAPSTETNVLFQFASADQAARAVVQGPLGPLSANPAGDDRRRLIKIRKDQTGAGKGRLFVVLDGSTNACDQADVTFFAPADGSSGGGTMQAMDSAAQRAWEKNSAKLAADVKKAAEGDGKTPLPGNIKFLVHLPSGKPVYASPGAITEGDPYQIAMLLPTYEQALPGLEVKPCEDVNYFRTTADVPSKSGQQSGEIEFKLVPLGRILECGAGRLEYTVTPISTYAAPNPAADDDDKKFRPTNGQSYLKVRPKYHLAATAVIGYDFANRNKFEKRRDANYPSTAPGQGYIIGEYDEKVGMIAYFGGTWMIGGVDYGNMHWYNYFANPFIAVDLSSPTSDVVIGTGITPVGKISLAVGLSLHKGQRLKTGYQVGGPFNGDGDIPTESTWNVVKPGFFIGIAIDQNALKGISWPFGTSSINSGAP